MTTELALAHSNRLLLETVKYINQCADNLIRTLEHGDITYARLGSQGLLSDKPAVNIEHIAGRTVLYIRGTPVASRHDGNTSAHVKASYTDRVTWEALTTMCAPSFLTELQDHISKARAEHNTRLRKLNQLAEAQNDS
jgi:hypothetical protein